MTESITADGLRTYLACPRRYDLQHRQGLGDRSSTAETRLSLCREAISDSMGASDDPHSVVSTGAAALERRWADHEEQFHSPAQRDHAGRVLAAGVRAHLESVGHDHRAGIETLLDVGVPHEELIGPGLRVSATVDESVDLVAPVDYITAAGRDLIAVRVIETPTRLGTIRYERDWEDVIEPAVTAHFDPTDSTHEVPTVATLLETAIVLRGLRAWASTHDLSDRLCRYCCVPVLTPWDREVNWRRGTVTSSVTPVDCTESYVEEQALARSLEHRNDTMADHLERLVDQIRAQAFDPRDRWTVIESAECPTCSVAVGCQDTIADAMRYDD